MFQTYVEIANPMNGAAYTVLFEMTTPDYCATVDRQSEIQTEFDNVLRWAEDQPKHVRDAYQWAAKKILENVSRRLEANALGNQVQQVLQMIPRPPGGAPSLPTAPTVQ